MLQWDYQKKLYYVLQTVNNRGKGLGYHLHHRLIIYNSVYHQYYLLK